MNPGKKLVAIVALLVIGLWWSGCAEDSQANPTEKPDRTPEKGVPVKILTLQPQPFKEYLEITGTVEARNHIQIMVEEGGTLRKVLRDKGRYVQAGDTLAILENKVLEAGYKQALAALHQAELDYRSKKVLMEKKALPENQYLAAKFALEAARAALDLARSRYEKLIILAPLNGLVNNRYYDIGAYCTPMTPLFEFLDNDSMRIRAGLAERFMRDIRPGTPVEVRFDAYPDLQLQTRIQFVSRSLDPQSRTFEIEVLVPNPGHRLASRMIANLRILRRVYTDHIVIPLDALMESESGWYVFVEENGRARKVPVKQVAIYENQVAVEGLSPGQHLIVVGHRELGEDDPVKVVQD